MDKSDFGHFSYYTSVVVYFSSFSLLGTLVYVRREIVKGAPLKGSFLMAPFINFVVGLGIVFVSVPTDFRILTELSIILTVSVVISVLTTICNGFEHYTEQYKMIIWMSIWNVVCLFFLFLNHRFSVEFLLRLWAINAVCIVPILIIRYWKTIRMIRVRWDGWRSLGPSYLSLIFLYSVGFPFEFSRYFDKWMIKTTFSGEFLGLYSFNVLIVTSFVSLFIRPLEGILATELAKINYSSASFSRVLSTHYHKIFILYFGLLFYFPASPFLLHLTGLSQYGGTVYLFLFIYVFYFLYSLGAPLLMLLNYNGKKRDLLFFFCANCGFFFLIFIGTRLLLHPLAFLVFFVAYQLLNFCVLLSLVPKSKFIFFQSIHLVARRFRRTLWFFDKHLSPDQLSIEA